MGRKITIEPVTRVEGHGKVTIHLDDGSKVAQSRLHIVEFRGFERFVQGRPYWEAPVLVQRLCGICPVSHHLAAAKAMDVIVGVGPEGLTPTAEKMRRLMHYGQMFQSHALHFFHLASPDLLFGVDADPAIRNVIGVALEHKDLAVQGGPDAQVRPGDHPGHGRQEDPRHRRHPRRHQQEPDHRGAGRVPEGPDPLNVDTMIDWAQDAVDLFKDFHSKTQGPHRRLRRLPLQPPQPRPQGRRPGLLPRRAAGGGRRREARSSTTSITRTT